MLHTLVAAAEHSPRAAGKQLRLADDTANRLQRRELLVLSAVQGLVGAEVFRGQYLSASGTHLAVQLSCCAVCSGRPLPGVLLVLVFLSTSSSARLLLQRLTVSVSTQKLLLFARVRQENQQLIEDAVEVVAKQVLTTAMILSS